MAKNKNSGKGVGGIEPAKGRYKKALIAKKAQNRKIDAERKARPKA